MFPSPRRYCSTRCSGRGPGPEPGRILGATVAEAAAAAHRPGVSTRYLASILLLASPILLRGASEAEAPVTTLPPLVVTATRAPQEPETLPLTVDVLGPRALAEAPTLSLDDTLRRSPTFSLFRRSGSLTANPTAQGVSLRGIGPSGASRALVLLDGVPVNDPFGGWVAWTKLPAGSLDRVEIVRGGGSAAWGGSSLGGVVHLVSAPLAPPAGEDREAGAPAGGWSARPGPRLGLTYGELRARGAELSATAQAPGGRDAFRVDAATFATDGPLLVRDPGPIDRRADLETHRGQLSWGRRIHETLTLTSTLRAWREDRGNGTPYQRNGSEELFGSFTLAGTPRDAAVSAWSVTLYAQDQDYRSTFSAVNAARDAETPASDQYSVPATALGFSAQASFGDGAASDARAGELRAPVTTLGVDARRVEGETRERFLFTGDEFANERRAGGVQTVAGSFVTHARPLTDELMLTLGARVDSIWRREGFRRENVRATVVVLVEERYANREDLAFSPSVGLAWRVTEAFTARAAAYAAYRTPTLNELYRPFRVGAITTNANPDLDPETLLGGELGLEWSAPERRCALRATVFENELSDAVANVTIAPNTRQRRNLDSARVRGLELGGFWQAAPNLRLDADYLLSDARVRSGGAGAEALDGRRLAQVPRHTVSAGAEWRVTRALFFDGRARWFSAQFEDDLNTLTLASAARVDVAARYAITPRMRVGLAVENLLDAEIQTGRNAAGVVNVAPPRLARAELSYQW